MRFTIFIAVLCLFFFVGSSQAQIETRNSFGASAVGMDSLYQNEDSSSEQESVTVDHQIVSDERWFRDNKGRIHRYSERQLTSVEYVNRKKGLSARIAAFWTSRRARMAGFRDFVEKEMLDIDPRLHPYRARLGLRENPRNEIQDATGTHSLGSTSPTVRVKLAKRVAPQITAGVTLPAVGPDKHAYSSKPVLDLTYARNFKLGRRSSLAGSLTLQRPEASQLMEDLGYNVKDFVLDGSLNFTQRLSPNVSFSLGAIFRQGVTEQTALPSDCDHWYMTMAMQVGRFRIYSAENPEPMISFGRYSGGSQKGADFTVGMSYTWDL